MMKSRLKKQGKSVSKLGGWEHFINYVRAALKASLVSIFLNDFCITHSSVSGKKLLIVSHWSQNPDKEMNRWERTFEPTNESEDWKSATHSYNFIIRVK